jgi:hypothetical protein
VTIAIGRAANLATLVCDIAEAHFSLTILPFKTFSQFNVSLKARSANPITCERDGTTIN